MENEKRKFNWLSSFMGSSLLFKNIKFILFVALLMVLYIFNGHQSNKTIRGIKTTATEVRELEAAYKDAKSKVMGKTSIGTLAKEAAKYNLQEFNEPPYKLLEKDTTVKK
jgi:hypothetical protein